jgi:hypothetical protein
MFQFSRLPSLAGCVIFNYTGCPIRTSMDHQLFASPHSFSQLTTSFIVSTSLGIPRTPFFASFFLLYLSSLLPLYLLTLVILKFFTPTMSMNFLPQKTLNSCFTLSYPFPFSFFSFFQTFLYQYSDSSVLSY